MNRFEGSRVAIVYHSGYGHTAKQAQAVARGAGSVDGVESLLISIDEIDRYWDTLEQRRRHHLRRADLPGQRLGPVQVPASNRRLGSASMRERLRWRYCLGTCR